MFLKVLEPWKEERIIGAKRPKRINKGLDNNKKKSKKQKKNK
jgi:hypothetical protein